MSSDTTGVESSVKDNTMKLTTIILALLWTQTHARLPTNDLFHRMHQPTTFGLRSRNLEDGTDLCSFEAFVAEECTYDEFCTATEPNSAVACEGLPTSTWTIEVTYFGICYESFDDFVGFPVDESTPLPENGYCLEESGLFTFSQQNLTKVRLNQTVTAPYSTSIIEEYDVVECPDSDLPNFVFGASYCYDGCPTSSSIDGTTCTGSCTICPDGTGLLNCSNLDPTLVYSCQDEFSDDNLYEELFEFLGQTETSNTTPAAAPVVSPTVTSPTDEMPVAAPGTTPSEAQTPSPDAESEQPVAPDTSSSGVITRFHAAMTAWGLMIVLVIH